MEAGDALAFVHARDEASADEGVAAVLAAYQLGESRPRRTLPVLRRIAA